MCNARFDATEVLSIFAVESSSILLGLILNHPAGVRSKLRSCGSATASLVQLLATVLSQCLLPYRLWPKFHLRNDEGLSVPLV